MGQYKQHATPPTVGLSSEEVPDVAIYMVRNMYLIAKYIRVGAFVCTHDVASGPRAT